MTLATKSLGLFELICDYPYLQHQSYYNSFPNNLLINEEEGKNIFTPIRIFIFSGLRALTGTMGRQ